jgi:hypothetical protein
VPAPKPRAAAPGRRNAQRARPLRRPQPTHLEDRTPAQTAQSSRLCHTEASAPSLRLRSRWSDLSRRAFSAINRTATLPAWRRPESRDRTDRRNGSYTNTPVPNGHAHDLAGASCLPLGSTRDGSSG